MTTTPTNLKAYIIELRDSDGNDCAVYDVLVNVPSRDAALDVAWAYIEETYPDDEDDGNYGTFHPCDCQCDHFVGNGQPGKQVGICDDCAGDSWECSHGGVSLDDYNIEEYATEREARDKRARYHILVDLTDATETEGTK